MKHHQQMYKLICFDIRYQKLLYAFITYAHLSRINTVQFRAASYKIQDSKRIIVISLAVVSQLWSIIHGTS